MAQDGGGWGGSGAVSCPRAARTHAAVDLDEAGADGGVLALDVEHPAGEPERQRGVDRQLDELVLLRAREHRRAVGAHLLEVRLDRRPVVRHLGVHRPALGQHDVHVNLRPVEVRLHHHLRLEALGGFAGVAVLGGVDERAESDDRAGHVRENLVVAGDELLLVVDADDAHGPGAADGLDDGGEAHLLRRLRELRLVLDEEVARRREARLLHDLAGGELVARGVHGGDRVAGEAEGLGEAGGDGHLQPRGFARER